MPTPLREPKNSLSPCPPVGDVDNKCHDSRTPLPGAAKASVLACRSARTDCRSVRKIDVADILMKDVSDHGRFILKNQKAAILFITPSDPLSAQQLALVDELHEDFPQVAFATAEIESSGAKAFEVMYVPSIVFFEDQQPLGILPGADPPLCLEALNIWNSADGKNKLVQLLQHRCPEGSTAAVLRALNEGRMQALTHAMPLMVFMKGNRDYPFCRFSKQLMEIFTKFGVKNFGTVDIMQDSLLRESLKVFSNWPTYPQIYVNGSLVGGVDIVKQLAESGELKSALPAEAFIEETVSIDRQ